MVDTVVRRDRIDLLVERDFTIGESYVADAVWAACNTGHQRASRWRRSALCSPFSESPSVASREEVTRSVDVVRLDPLDVIAKVLGTAREGVFPVVILAEFDERDLVPSFRVRHGSPNISRNTERRSSSVRAIASWRLRRRASALSRMSGEAVLL